MIKLIKSYLSRLLRELLAIIFLIIFLPLNLKLFLTPDYRKFVIFYLFAISVKWLIFIGMIISRTTFLYIINNVLIEMLGW